MKKSSKKTSQGRVIGLVVLGLISLVLITMLLLRGNDVALLNPQGFIAGEQRRLLTYCVIILLDIGIPTLAIFYFTAWRYRESNKKAIYDSRTHHGKFLVFSMWAVPTIFMLLLAMIMWPATHKLAPQRQINNGIKPVSIQVVAMSWKWLFIYPEHNIATVNFIQIPTGTPVQFDLTADEVPMSSFWIPHLGGQLYAMTGHVNRLNLLADKPGDYTGSAAEINGPGFAGMKFVARASSAEDFDQWVKTIQGSKEILTANEYEKLLAPSEYNQAAFYSEVEQGLYATMLKKYSGSHGSHTEAESE